MDYMDISLSVLLEEAEIIIMNGISQGAVLPFIDHVAICTPTLRTGVITFCPYENLYRA